MRTVFRRRAALGNNLKAAALMCIAMFLLTSSDVLIKQVGEHLAVGQIMLIRSLFACLLFTGFFWYLGKPVMAPAMFARPNVIRAVLDTLLVATFMSGLMLLPIAIVTTLTWLAPLFMTLFSALLLKEQVPLLRWGAVVVGFAGVWMVSDPGDAGLSWFYVLPLLTAVLLAVRDIFTRKIDSRLHAGYIAFFAMLMLALAGAGWSIFDWRPVDTKSVALLAVCAVLVSLSFIAQITAVRMGDLSFVAPFAFSSVLFATVYGIFVWGELPSLFMLAGMGVIVAAGLVVVASDR